MAKTLLDGVNDVAKKLQIIAGNSGDFTSLTSLPHQHSVDIIIRNWNTGIEDLYSATSVPYPNELASADITLVTGQREYDIPSDLITMRWPLHDITNGEYIHEFKGGYEYLRMGQQTPNDENGKPLYGAINPSNGRLYFDKIPRAAENGLVYELLYDKDVSLESQNDVFPFNDAVYRPMVDVVAELTRRDIRNRFDGVFHDRRMAQAGKYLRKTTAKKTWLPIRVLRNTGDPYNA